MSFLKPYLTCLLLFFWVIVPKSTAWGDNTFPEPKAVPASEVIWQIIDQTSSPWLVSDHLRDEGNSDGKSGNKEAPQVYFGGGTRFYNQVERDELTLQQTHRHYSSDVLWQLPIKLKTPQGGLLLPGYYHLHVGGALAPAGSAKLHLGETWPEDPTPPRPPKKQFRSAKPLANTLVIKRTGIVLAVLPVSSLITAQKQINKPFARFESSQLRLYDRNMIYCVDLAPTTPAP